MKTCKRKNIFYNVYNMSSNEYVHVMTRYFWILHDSCNMKSMGNHDCISLLDTIEFLLFSLFTCCISEITCCERKMELVPNVQSHYMHFSLYIFFVSFTSREGRRCNSKAMQIKKKNQWTYKEIQKSYFWGKHFPKRLHLQ